MLKLKFSRNRLRDFSIGQVDAGRVQAHSHAFDDARVTGVGRLSSSLALTDTLGC